MSEGFEGAGDGLTKIIDWAVVGAAPLKFAAKAYCDASGDFAQVFALPLVDKFCPNCFETLSTLRSSPLITSAFASGLTTTSLLPPFFRYETSI